MCGGWIYVCLHLCVFMCVSSMQGCYQSRFLHGLLSSQRKCSEPERQRTEQVRGIAQGKGARRDALRWLQLCSYSWL